MTAAPRVFGIGIKAAADPSMKMRRSIPDKRMLALSEKHNRFAVHSPSELGCRTGFCKRRIQVFRAGEKCFSFRLTQGTESRGRIHGHPQKLLIAGRNGGRYIL